MLIPDHSAAVVAFMTAVQHFEEGKIVLGADGKYWRDLVDIADRLVAEEGVQQRYDYKSFWRPLARMLRDHGYIEERASEAELPRRTLALCHAGPTKILVPYFLCTPGLTLVGRAAIANARVIDFELDADMELPSTRAEGGGGGGGSRAATGRRSRGAGGRSRWADPAYRAQMIGKGGRAGNGGGGGGRAGRERRPRGDSKPRTCNKCGQLGHRWRSCPN